MRAVPIFGEGLNSNFVDPALLRYQESMARIACTNSYDELVKNNLLQREALEYARICERIVPTSCLDMQTEVLHREAMVLNSLSGAQR